MYATIDVGSNTVRLLLGDMVSGNVEPFLYERRITRLKGGQSDDGLLVAASMDRTAQALKEFSQLLAIYRPVAVRAVGTAALRQAANAELFLQRVIGESGLMVEVIPGEEEARLSALGVTAALSPTPENSLIVDVGGGSTEFVLLKQGHVCFEQSIPLGVVTLAERFKDHEAGLRFIATSVKRVFMLMSERGENPFSGCRLVGTAGTATTMAAISLQMQAYDWRRVNNYCISTAELESMRAQLQALSLSEREALPGMEVGRGDLILHGIAIYQQLMQQLGVDVMTISDFGLLEGVLVDLAGPNRPAADN